jgi:hypothetical protein
MPGPAKSKRLPEPEVWKGLEEPLREDPPAEDLVASASGSFS